MSNKNTRRDYSTLLLYSDLIVSVARYAGAFIASDTGKLTGWVSTLVAIAIGISGVGMGILDVLGSAYIFDGWRRLLPASGKNWPSRFKVLTFFVFALFFCGIGILIPFTVSRVLDSSMADVLPTWMLWGWAALVNSIPMLILGGVFISQSGIVSVNNAQTETHESHDANEMQKDAMHELHGDTHKEYVCEKCNETFANRNKFAAHKRWAHK